MDFPFADAPGIIRAHQKDSFIEHDLYTRIRDVLQAFRGVRFVHNWTSQIQAFSTFFYLALTSLVGSRTLGEEYTDVFYLTPDRKIPSSMRIGLYVLTSGLAPLVIPKLTLAARNYLRRRYGQARREARHETEDEDEDEDDGDDEDEDLIEEYLTPTTLISVNLAIFYFSGAYYQISKRLFGLRYAFGHSVDPLSQPSASYELIGMLMIIRALFKLTSQVRSRIPSAKQQAPNPESSRELPISLEDDSVLSFIRGQSRKCNLCLEYMSAPTVTLCGHVFCWSCISDWCRDQSECPLCRQECHEQHLLCMRP